MKHFARNFDFLVEKAKLNNQDLATFFKKDQTVIADWRKKKQTPGIQDMLMMSHLFGISIEALLLKDITGIEESSLPARIISLSRCEFSVLRQLVLHVINKKTSQPFNTTDLLIEVDEAQRIKMTLAWITDKK